jgi:3'-phosphoadenosine 5'-phosphosulfate sulfotransferase (PAPS reductase)/FAD synthetase
MKNYLSYGGGVNSTAMLLILHDEGQNFESIYVDHGCDWPETREYVHEIMVKRFPITILTPQVDGYSNLHDYASRYAMIPSRKTRWCTNKFKVSVINAYVQKPYFSLIGFSPDEAKRAKLSSQNGIENRFPLLEREIDREGCIEIIKAHGLPVPIKSGCWFCPFQRIGQWKLLRRRHPNLFCKAQQLEAREMEARAKIGKGPLYLASKNRTLEDSIKGRQVRLFEEYPPCNCTL